MISTIQNWLVGTLSFDISDKMGKLFLRNGFTPESVLDVRQMVESGTLKR